MNRKRGCDRQERRLMAAKRRKKVKEFRLISVLVALAMFAGIGYADAAAKKNATAETPDILVASVPNPKFDIFVNAICRRGKTALIRLVNKGERWPELGEFKIFRTSDNSVITLRRLKMETNQVASFRLQGTYHRGDEIGVFIDPDWFDRNFEYDKRITCK